MEFDIIFHFSFLIEAEPKDIKIDQFLKLCIFSDNKSIINWNNS